MHANRRLSYAQGYYELGMLAEAAAELAQVPESADAVLEVIALRMAVAQAQENWPVLQAATAKFVEREPGDAGAWVIWAYAARRGDSLAAAEKILLEAERQHSEEPTIQFNLGCYACQRGDLKEARRRVDDAIARDEKFRELAASDADLAPLRDAERADCPPTP